MPPMSTSGRKLGARADVDVGATGTVPGIVDLMSWNVGGGIRVTRVVEHVMPFAVDFFVEASPADLAQDWLKPDFVSPTGQYLMALQSFVIEVARLRILVDTGIGNFKSRPEIPEFDQQDRPFLAKLAAAGFAPETIDLVVCTHLHVDHVGWNTVLDAGEWSPTFPNARYLFAEPDIDFFANSDDSLHRSAFVDSVRPIIAAGLVDRVDGNLAVSSEVELRSTPGHTPGHHSVWIGDRAVITGDVLHHPIQCSHPEWTGRGDADPELAATTRRALLNDAASSGALVLGTHFAGSAAGHVRYTDSGYRFEPVEAG